MCVTGRSQAIQADLLKRLTPCLPPFVPSHTAPPNRHGAQCRHPGKPARSSGCFDHARFNVQSSSGGHVHQRIESEQVDLAEHQIGDAWLSHAPKGCGAHWIPFLRPG